VDEHLHRTARYHRAHLQQALLAHIPKDIIHLGKKISSVDADAKKGVALKFGDGTTATADLLIGADGIRSVSALITISAPIRNRKWQVSEPRRA
jgi:salicylate hydroxylase